MILLSTLDSACARRCLGWPVTAPRAAPPTAPIVVTGRLHSCQRHAEGAGPPSAKRTAQLARIGLGVSGRPPGNGRAGSGSCLSSRALTCASERLLPYALASARLPAH